MAPTKSQLSSNALQESPGPSWELNNSLNLYCPECLTDPPNIIDEYSSGDTVCGDCGLVVGPRIVDTRSEWRTFADADSSGSDPNRVGTGANPLLHGSQLETAISFKPGEQASRLQRTHEINNAQKVNRTLQVAYVEIGAYCAAISITSMVSDAVKVLFKVVVDTKALRGHSRAAIIAGCIFIACRQGQVPRTFTEIFALTKIPKREIARTFRALEKLLRQRVDDKQVVIPPAAEGTVAATAESLLIRYACALSLDPKVGIAAQVVAKKVEEVGALLGRSPVTCAVAILYMVCWLMGCGVTVKRMSEVTGVSEPSVKLLYTTLYRHKALYLTTDWIASVDGDIGRLPVASGRRSVIE